MVTGLRPGIANSSPLANLLFSLLAHPTSLPGARPGAMWRWCVLDRPPPPRAAVMPNDKDADGGGQERRSK
ncbi:hypothetical protein E2C01_040279 [Portunus trituberculatus]|uniref:Uncharacterized protein n=1 Tax=Portunus trituberculatus TaxID=210409 RepID=A0A5B7FMX6_PORTR|nr:hypothetical protein [Portunus trituberculatus]